VTELDVCPIEITAARRHDVPCGESGGAVTSKLAFPFVVISKFLVTIGSAGLLAV
jgi:hypothetical protein